MLELAPETEALLDSGASLVTPTRQRALAVRLAYAAGAVRSGRSVWRSPDALALGTWLEREWTRDPQERRRLLASAEEWLLWREVAHEAARAEEALFGDAMTEGLRRAAALLADWEIPVAALEGLPGSETRVLRRALLAFAQRCEAAGVIAQGELPAAVAARAPRAAPAALAGFAPGDPAARRFGGVALARPSRAARVRLAAAIDPDHELELIAEWALGLLTADPTRRLLVVLPDLAERAPRCARVLRGALDPGQLLGFGRGGETPAFALEGGAPLASYPLVAHALEALTIAVEALEFLRVSAWLRAPFWSDPDAAERARVDVWLRGRGRSAFDLRQLIAELEGASPDTLPGAARLRERLGRALEPLGVAQGSPRLWAQRFRASLEALDWPGFTALTSAEAQLRARFIELLREFGSIAITARNVAAPEALGILRALAHRVAFEPATGDTPLTVTAAIGDPVVAYDGIWVAGLQANAWPPPAQPDPFVPWSLLRRAGVPAATPAGQLARARTALDDWRGSTPELVLSYARHVDDAPGMPSPLLPLAEVLPYESAARPRSLADRLRVPGALEELVDEQGPAWVLTLPVPGGSRALELQNQCAFRAFAELRLGARPLEEPARGVDPRLRGQLLHRALEKLWQVLHSSAGLAAHAPPALAPLIEARVRAAARELLAGAADPTAPRVSEREIARATRLIAELCELERSRAPFTVRAMELPRRFEVHGALLDVRLDRLDQLDDGTLVILDYKSGRSVAQRWQDEPLSHPQLLAYLLAVQTLPVTGEVAALATTHLARAGVEFRGIAALEGLLPRVGTGTRGRPSWPSGEWARQLESWRGIGRRLVDEFVAGKASVEPAPDACAVCHLHGFCRIADWPLSASAGAESESESESEVEDE